jgi:hypothetical protein
MKQLLMNGQERAGSGGPTVYDIPEFFVLDASFSGEELYFPLGDTTRLQATALERVRSAIPQTSGPSRRNHSSNDPPSIERRTADDVHF